MANAADGTSGGTLVSGRVKAGARGAGSGSAPLACGGGAPNSSGRPAVVVASPNGVSDPIGPRIESSATAGVG